ncbi:MAG: hypothetical protein M0006_04685 [Magnetospirillum sp.]|nr:hypothetical protein [Magnetospirillum sp.]
MTTTREQLLEYYQEFGDSDYSAYTKYLYPHWEGWTNSNNWSHLVTDHFNQCHVCDGTVTPERAEDLFMARSNNGSFPFTSTLLSESFILAITRAIRDNVIRFHAGTVRAFANYELAVKGYMITVTNQNSTQTRQTLQYRDGVVVGIDRRGLINHFHGDASYASGGDIYVPSGQGWKKKGNL